MKTKLGALLFGLAVLGSAGVDRADAAPPAETGPVTLTERQMANITAGHITPQLFPNSTHYGSYLKKKCVWVACVPIPWVGWHYDPGLAKLSVPAPKP
jgi:hypothetical protein